MSRAQSFWRRTARLLLAGSLLTAIVISPADPASAVSIQATDQLGGFEQGGNQALDASLAGDADWQSVQTTSLLVTDTDVRYDNADELNNTNWTCVNETGVPSRTNLQEAYINGPRTSLDSGDPTDDHIYLDLAWVREAASEGGIFDYEGEAHVAMEFNQALLDDVAPSAVSTPCGFTRMEGDVLVTWDMHRRFIFPGVFSNLNVQLYRWSEGAANWVDAGLAAGVHATGGANGVGIGSIDDYTPQDAGQPGTLGLLRFGEVTLDLTELGLMDDNNCTVAGTVHGRSRDDDSIGGEAMDRLPFTQLRYQNPDCASIVLHKELNPTGDSGRFDLNIDGNTVVDEAGDGASDGALVQSGNHILTETEDGEDTNLANYITTIACKDQQGAVAVDEFGSIMVDPGDAIDCTFTNTRRSTIVLRKVLDPTGDPGRFDLNVDGTPVVDEAGNGANNAATPTVVDPGAHNVTETEDGDDTILANYLTTVACHDQNDAVVAVGQGGSITVDPGDAIDCTFTNTRRGTVVLRKVLDPAGDLGKFDLRVDATTVVDEAGNGGNNAGSPFAVNPGAHTVTETEDGDDTILANYLTTVACHDQNDAVVAVGQGGSITVDPGAVIDCTFTNTRRAAQYRLTVTADDNSKTTGRPTGSRRSSRSPTTAARPGPRPVGTSSTCSSRESVRATS